MKEYAPDRIPFGISSIGGTLSVFGEYNYFYPLMPFPINNNPDLPEIQVSFLPKGIKVSIVNRSKSTDIFLGRCQPINRSFSISFSKHQS